MNRFDRGGSSLGKNVDIMDGDAVVGRLNGGFWKRRLTRPSNSRFVVWSDSSHRHQIFIL